MNKSWLKLISLAVIVVSLSFFLNIVIRIFCEIYGLDYLYNDGLSVVEYVCTLSSLETDGFMGNSIPVLMYLHLTSCNNNFQISAMIFNYAVIVFLTYVIFKHYHKPKDIYELMLYTMSINFLTFTSFYPSKELICFIALTYSLAKINYIFQLPAILMRPSYVFIIFSKNKIFVNNSLKIFIVYYLIYLFMIQVLGDWQPLMIYFYKAVEHGLDQEAVLSTTFQLYKILVSFVGYRHLFESISAYGIINITSQIVLIYLIVRAALYDRSKFLLVFSIMCLVVFSYPFAHTRFMYVFLPFFIFRKNKIDISKSNG